MPRSPPGPRSRASADGPASEQHGREAASRWRHRTAPTGARARLRALAARGAGRPTRASRAPRLPGHRDARRRQDHLRADAGAGCWSSARVVDRVIVVCPTDHLRTQWAEAADAAGSAARPDADQRGRARSAPTCAATSRPTRRSPAKPALHAARADRATLAGDPRRGAPRRRRAVLGRRGGDGVRAGRPPAVPDRHPVPHPAGRADPVRALRAGRRGRLAQRGRLHLRLPGRAARRRGAPGGLRRLHRHVAVAQQRRRGRSPRRSTEPSTKRTEATAWRTALNPKRQVGAARHRGDGRAASPTCARRACPMPPGWCSPATRTTPGPTPRSSSRSPARRRC